MFPIQPLIALMTNRKRTVLANSSFSIMRGCFEEGVTSVEVFSKDTRCGSFLPGTVIIVNYKY